MKRRFGFPWEKPHCAKCGAHGICAVPTFHSHLERERDRSDRSGGVFALVVFEPPAADEKNDPAGALIRLIHERLRLADLAGWLSDTEIGVLLADTPLEGARIFMEYIAGEWRPEWGTLSHRAFAYPSPSDGDDENQLWFDDLPSVREDPAVARCFAPYPRTDSGSWTAPLHLTAAAGRPRAPATSEEAVNGILAVRPPLWKRWIDVTLSLAALLVLSPMMLAIALSIRLSSRGPALYRQERVGYRGRVFRCYKFRTMHVHSGEQAHRNYMSRLLTSDIAMRKLDEKKDPRVFPVGRFLRSTSLDELPQLINVLRGEMSLIGPRPCIPYEYRQYKPWHRHRVDALPGLTGLWQVSGKNKTTFSEMIRLDRTYAKKTSLWLDLLIAFRTLPVVVAQYLEQRGGRKADSGS